MSKLKLCIWATAPAAVVAGISPVAASTVAASELPGALGGMAPPTTVAPPFIASDEASLTTLAPTTTLPAPGTSTTTPPVTAATTTGTPTGTPTGAGNNLVPPASLLPDSLFNQTVQNWPVDPGSTAIVADIVNQYRSAYGAVAVNTNRPVYWVPANQALVPIAVAPGCNDFTPSTGTEIPIPSYAVAGSSSDEILTVYQPSTGNAWEFWQATESPSGAWSACWGGKLDMTTSDGVFAYPYGETASGISNLATEITEADVASGSIDHAIAMEALGNSCDWASGSVSGGLYPADRADCTGNAPDRPAEGQWFRLPASLAMPSGLTPFARMVFKALQTYGAVVVDQGGAVALEADQTGTWAAEGHSGTVPLTASMDGAPAYSVVASLPWDDLQAIDPPGAPFSPLALTEPTTTTPRGGSDGPVPVDSDRTPPALLTGPPPTEAQVPESPYVPLLPLAAAGLAGSGLIAYRTRRKAAGL
jgi:hypothetical protein